MDFSLSGLYQSLMRDIPISDYDRKYVLTRLAAEGLTFLAVELPKVSKSVIVGLETGYFDRVELTSFRFKGAILHFCEELISLVFSRVDGKILPNPDGPAIGAIRQLCEYSYKLAVPFTLEKENEAKANFVKNEDELSALGRDSEVLRFATQLRKDFETHWPKLARAHVHEILSSYPPRPTAGTFVGSDDLYFIDRLSTTSRTYPAGNEAYKGFYKTCGVGLVSNRPSERMGGTYSFKVSSLNETNHSELLLVPKDSRGPRTICRESRMRVETQMSYFDFMSTELTRGSQGAINFLDQQVNRLIAEKSSVSKSYATLDLKDASDRVSYQVVKTIFRNCPGLYWFVTGCRRASSVLVDNDLRQLNKLAGMGSGLTFPTMSLIISLAICNLVSKVYTDLNYDDIRKKIYVYGDDICVPTRWVGLARCALSNIGLKVNEQKSFVRGNFRESCGGDYFDGHDVTPCRIKLTNSKAEYYGLGRIKLADNADSFKQLYEHSKELWKHGFFSASKYLMSILNREYFNRFGIRMVAGVFDVDCSLPVDYTIGTRHLDVKGTSVLYTIRPEQIRGLDSRKIISNKGVVYELDTTKALYTKLAATPRSSHGLPDRSTEKLIDGRLRNLDISRIKPASGSDFGDVTRPRKQAFAKVKVLNEFLCEQLLRSREDWLESHHVDRAYEAFAAVIVTVATHDLVSTWRQV